MLSLIQKQSALTGIINDNLFNMVTVHDDFYDLLLQKKLTAARKFVMDHNYNYEEMYTDLFRNFIPKLEKGVQAQGIIIIADYMNQHAFAIDPEITFTAMLIELMSDCC